MYLLVGLKPPSTHTRSPNHLIIKSNTSLTKESSWKQPDPDSEEASRLEASLKARRDELRRLNREAIARQVTRDRFVTRAEQQKVVWDIVAQPEDTNKEDKQMMVKLKERDHLDGLFIKTHQKLMKSIERNAELKKTLQAVNSEIEVLADEVRKAEQELWSKTVDEAGEEGGGNLLQANKASLESLRDLLVILAYGSEKIVMTSKHPYENTEYEWLVHAAENLSRVLEDWPFGDGGEMGAELFPGDNGDDEEVLDLDVVI
ncbi:hypothetical protein HDU76_000801 [Blyttiomyces sp. JEL0837]|nr:hypothetical protein HDU76_000801 [Blyttiomyces sp. JEL0837]